MLCINNKPRSTKRLGCLMGVLVVLFLIATFWLHQYFYISSDTAWLLELAHRVLNGGNYSTDFIEINPPLIIYLHMIPVLLFRITHLNLLTSMTLSVYLLIILSLVLTHSLLKKLLPTAPYVRLALLGSCLVNYTLLSGYEFSQRECLTVMLIVPYWILLILRVRNIPLSTWSALLISCLAAIGFCIKPQFFIAFLLLEGFLIIRYRSLSVLFTLESVTVVLIAILYVLSIYFFTPNYLFQIIPWSWEYYYSSLHITWFSNIVASYFSLFVYSTFVLYAFVRHRATHKDLCDIFCLGAASFWLVYILQKTSWYYHAAASLMLAINLLTLLVADLLCHKKLVKDWFAWVIGAYVLACCLTTCVINVTGSIAVFNTSGWIKLIRIVKSYPPEIYMAELSNHCFPLLQTNVLTNTHSSSQQMSAWTIPALYSDSPWSSSEKMIERKRMQKRYVDDFKKHPPQIVIVDSTLDLMHGKIIRFNYVRFFSENPRFKNLWENYRYITRVGRFNLYVLRQSSSTPHSPPSRSDAHPLNPQS